MFEATTFSEIQHGEKDQNSSCLWASVIDDLSLFLVLEKKKKMKKKKNHKLLETYCLIAAALESNDSFTSEEFHGSQQNCYFPNELIYWLCCAAWMRMKISLPPPLSTNHRPLKVEDIWYNHYD